MIFELSKENIELAKEEVLALAGTRDYKLYKNLLICEGEFDYSRLAFTNRVLDYIFVSDKVEDVEWSKYYKINFCVRSNITSKEKKLAGLIWNKVENPKVKLNKPVSEFWFFFVDDKVICGKKVYKREEKFHLRRPHLRPGFFPVSLKPKLARCLVNLTGVREGTIWDPFCGTGGFLIEAALIKLKVVGTDLDPMMVRAAKKNFEQYNIDGELRVGDARKERVECDAVVTDPPYGRRVSLKKAELRSLYEEFLENIYPFVDTVVIMTPNNLKFSTKYKVVFETKDFVHKSLTRNILVLKKQD